MAKVLSIELGHSVIKLCEMDYKVKRPKIYQCHEGITPLGAVVDGYISQNKMKELAYAVKEIIARNGIKTKKVIFTVASSKIITREVTVPAVKENQIGSVVQANLSEYFPVSLTEYEVTQSLVQTISEGPDAGKHRVLVFAAEKSMLDSYRALASACGLDVLNVCCSGAGIIESARNAKTAGCQAIIKMEEKYSIVSIVKDGVLLLQRSINYGVGDAMNEVATQPSFAAGDTLGVWRVITRQNCTTEPIAGVKEAGRPEAREAVTEALNPLLSGTMRVLDYFNSHFNGEEIEGVSLIGLGAQFIGVAEILGEALGIVCKKANMLQDIDVVDSDVKQKSDAYFSCIGAGFSGEGFLHDSAKDKAKKETDYTLLTVLVGIVAVVGVGALAAASIIPYNKAKSENETLQAEYATYQQGLDVYNAKVAAEDVLQKIKHADSMSEHKNDALYDFLVELEEKMPKDVEFLEFKSDDEQAEIQISFTDKETAAKAIETLRGFESVSYVYGTTVDERLMTEQDSSLRLAEMMLAAEAEGVEFNLEEVLETTFPGYEIEEDENGEEVLLLPEVIVTTFCVYNPRELAPEVVVRDEKTNAGGANAQAVAQ